MARYETGARVRVNVASENDRWNRRDDWRPGTVKAAVPHRRNSTSRYTVRLDDGGTHEAYEMLVRRVLTAEQLAQARVYAERAGYECRPGMLSGHEWHSERPGPFFPGRQPDDGLTELFSHFGPDAPDCDTCTAPVELNRRTSSRCSGCEYWTGYIAKVDGVRVVVDEPRGRGHYVAHLGGGGPYDGFGGQLFRIEIVATGRVFECRNLWRQGVIPERFHDLYPVNARFVDA